MYIMEQYKLLISLFPITKNMRVNKSRRKQTPQSRFSRKTNIRRNTRILKRRTHSKVPLFARRRVTSVKRTGGIKPLGDVRQPPEYLEIQSGKSSDRRQSALYHLASRINPDTHPNLQNKFAKQVS